MNEQGKEMHQSVSDELGSDHTFPKEHPDCIEDTFKKLSAEPHSPNATSLS